MNHYSDENTMICQKQQDFEARKEYSLPIDMLEQDLGFEY